MKTNLRLVSTLLAGSLLLSGVAVAQDAPMGGQVIASAQYNTPQGQLTVNSELSPGMNQTPPPSFEQLANGGKYITPAMAAAYPPLANDFGYANSSHTGKLTKAEYQQWVKQL